MAYPEKIMDNNQFLEETKRTRQGEDSDLLENQLDSLEPPEDFRKIPVIPTLHELINDPNPFLRPNKIKGPYRSSEHYLDVHFRLLREDFVEPLRNAVQEFIKNKEKYVQSIGTGGERSNRDQEVRTYTDVMFLECEKSQDMTMTENYLFSLPEVVVTEVNWYKSKRLSHGSLVMLTADFCETAVFATTVLPPFDPLMVTTEEGDPRRKELASGILRLAVETGKEFVTDDKPYIMLECEAFFEAYRHNLRILQTIKFLEDDVLQPKFLNRIIVQALPEVQHPAYLEKETNIEIPIGYEEDEEGNSYGFGQQVLSVSPFHPETWPAKKIQEKLKVDPDQYEALKTALTSELAVIQGPPGTGKTYVGLQIVKALLHNKWNRFSHQSPFLVICYTNHALDQFLELLVQEVPSLSLVRVGGQSKSEMLQDYTLSVLRKNVQLVKHKPSERERLKRKEVNSYRLIRSLKKSLDIHNAEVAAFSNPIGIFDFWGVQERHRLKQTLPFSLWNAISTPEWLEFETLLTNGVQIEQIVSTLFIVKPESSCTSPGDGGVANGDLSLNENAMEDSQGDSQYSMDELLEHRLVDGDDLTNNVGAKIPGLYFPLCCVPHCKWKRRFVDKLLGSAYERAVKEPYTPLKTARVNNVGKYSISLAEGSIDLEKRATLLSIIFGLYEKGRLDLPNVDTTFRKADDGRRYVMVGDENVSECPVRWKWSIYFKVVGIALELTEERREEVKVELEEALRVCSEERLKLDGCILRQADIVGMTTTGAAKMHGLLEISKPEVVIVEEAAEILEGHIVTSLTKDCKHLILIGDHLQLRPSANVYRLWKIYHLNISLFERMLLNGIPLCSLKTQHRMRPEISNLLIGPIYDVLYDHEKVHKYPPIKGVAKSMFFVNHHELEEADKDLFSKSNYHEAAFLTTLCEYLLKQGYEHHQITILSTYTGQMSVLRKMLPESCRGVKITCVDNYQGEECDIILLSLVRSNEEDRVGFVAVDNRICVALSRARHGLYVMGNMDGLVVASKTWGKIEQKLKAGGNIGDTLELVCAKHGKRTEVKKGGDFASCQNGGCDQICEAMLPCGHPCRQVCHGLDDTHEEKFGCLEKCDKKCESGHQCEGLCSGECPPCTVEELKTLPCQHQKAVPCHQDVYTVSCATLVLKERSCGHEVELECSSDVETFLCAEPVEYILSCGHFHTLECCMPPDLFECEMEDSNELLSCGHYSSRIPDYEVGNSGECIVAVERTLECGHKTTVKCCVPVENIQCEEDVEKLLRCGHVYTMKCFRPAHGVRCKLIVDFVLPGCSHIQKIACHRRVYAKCTKECGKTLVCGHSCTLTCHLKEDPYQERCVCQEGCDRSYEAEP